MRSLLLSSLEGFADKETWDLRYVDVDPWRNAAVKAVVDQKVRLLHKLYRPGSESGNRQKRITIGGDQPTKKMLMESFIASVLEPGSGLNFADWATPLLGASIQRNRAYLV